MAHTGAPAAAAGAARVRLLRGGAALDVDSSRPALVLHPGPMLARLPPWALALVASWAGARALAVLMASCRATQWAWGAADAAPAWAAAARDEALIAGPAPSAVCALVRKRAQAVAAWARIDLFLPRSLPLAAAPAATVATVDRAFHAATGHHLPVDVLASALVRDGWAVGAASLGPGGQAPHFGGRPLALDEAWAQWARDRANGVDAWVRSVLAATGVDVGEAWPLTERVGAARLVVGVPSGTVLWMTGATAVRKAAAWLAFVADA
jgi:hypothetical protein